MKPEKNTKNTVKIKLIDLLNDSRKLDDLCKIELPIKTSYWLNRINDKVKSEVKSYIRTKDMLIERLGEEKDGTIEVKKDNLKEFYDEDKKLTDVEIELEINQINLSDLGDRNIKPELILSWVFKLD